MGGQRVLRDRSDSRSRCYFSLMEKMIKTSKLVQYNKIACHLRKNILYSSLCIVASDVNILYSSV